MKSNYNSKYMLFFVGSDISHLLTVMMAGSVKLFQFIYQTYQSLGIYPTQPSRSYCPFNWKKWVIVISGVQYFVSALLFVLFEAKSMYEYGMTFYTLLWVVFATGTYIVPTWQMRHTMEFTECCERFIESSKLIAIAGVLICPKPIAE